MRLRFQKGDILAVGLVLLLAALALLLFLPKPASEAAVVEIYHNGALVKTLPLTQDGEYTVQGRYVNVVSVSGGRVSICRSDCPGHDCVYSGSIAAEGRSLVCLPNAVEVRITGRGGDVDFVVG